MYVKAFFLKIDWVEIYRIKAIFLNIYELNNLCNKLKFVKTNNLLKKFGFCINI